MATKSDIVSGMGLAMSIITDLVNKVKKAGGTEEDIHRLATPEGETILEKMADIVVGAKRQTLRVLVDYTKSLKEMIKAGRYDWVSSDITQEHFPITGQDKQEREIVLFHFNRIISSDDAIKEMDAAGYRPATLEELLALGEAQPELQRTFPIVALKSVWRGPSSDRHVPGLCGYTGGRRLDLRCFGRGWCEASRFAAVRNAS